MYLGSYSNQLNRRIPIFLSFVCHGGGDRRTISLISSSHLLLFIDLCLPDKDLGRTEPPSRHAYPLAASQRRSLYLSPVRLTVYRAIQQSSIGLSIIFIRTDTYLADQIMPTGESSAITLTTCLGVRGSRSAFC